MRIPFANDIVAMLFNVSFFALVRFFLCSLLRICVSPVTGKFAMAKLAVRNFVGTNFATGNWASQDFCCVLS